MVITTHNKQMKRKDFGALTRLGLEETLEFVFYVPRYDMVLSPMHEDALDNFGKLVKQVYSDRM